MIIKKYQAKTESEAVEQARKELGEGVVILSVRSKKKKGLFSFIFPAMTEITAALEDDNTQTPKKNEPAAKKSAQNLTTGSLQVKNESSRQEELIPKELVAQSIPEALRDKEPMLQTTVSPKIPLNNASSGIEERLDSLQNLIEKQMMPRQETAPPPTVQDNNIPGAKKENDSFVKLLYDTMIDNEVSPENADIIIKEIEGSTKQGQSIDHLLANVYQKMILKFGKSMGIRPAEKGVKVLFFIGPTGVGKTTTIAKIASRFRVEEKKKVALLTADTYRIAAAEQLATYANILDVPFRIVYTPGEMTGAISEYMDYDYVLVDTAGHSHYNEVQKENMNQFIHSMDGLTEREVFLVVSATTKYRDLLYIADAYRGITEYKLIFTKLDETTTLGNLLNLKLYTGSEISYVTCGQNVPDDIENFNPQKTVKKLLGGKR